MREGVIVRIERDHVLDDPQHPDLLRIYHDLYRIDQEQC